MKTKTMIICSIAIALVIGSISILRKPKPPTPLTLEQSLTQQAKDGGVYQPANLPAWRAALMLRLKPEVALIGSGQTAAFRSDNFNSPFLNLTGFDRLADAVAATQQLFPQFPPKTLLLALDVRWLHPAVKPDCRSMTCARQTGDGYEADGSYLPLSLWTEKNAPKNITPPPSANIDSAEVEKFSTWLAALKAQDISVIVFVPPAMSKMQADENLADVASAAKKLDISFYDERRALPRPNDCEFSNGDEGGEILAKRLLLDIATRDTTLQSVVRLAEIGWDIDHFAGRVSKLPAEADFLGLGCSKTVKAPQ